MAELITAVFNTEREKCKAPQLCSLGEISMYFMLKVTVISKILLRYGSSVHQKNLPVLFLST